VTKAASLSVDQNFMRGRISQLNLTNGEAFAGLF
jgi:hypothetical protein